MVRSIVLLLALFWMQSLGRAQTTYASDEYSSRLYNVSNGLPQSAVFGIKQSSDGFIWISTLAGIARFDGESFVSFDASTIPGLKSDMFGSMISDNKSGIWAISDHDLVHIQKNTANRYHLPFNAHTAGIIGLAMLGNRTIIQRLDSLYMLEGDQCRFYCKIGNNMQLLEGDGSSLYFYQDRQLLLKLENKIFKTVARLPEKTDQIFFLEHRFWCNKENRLYDISLSGKVSSHEFPDSVSRTCYEIVPLRHHRFALSCKNALYIFNDSLHSLEKIKVSGDEDCNLYMRLEDAVGNLWVYTSQFNLVHFIKKGIRSYPVMKVESTSLETGQYFIYSNPSDHSIWLDSKIKYMGDNKPVFRKLIRLKNGKATVQLSDYNAEIRTMLIDHRDNIWFSDTYDGLCVKYKNSNNIQHIRAAKNPYFSLFQSRDHRIWFGTGSGVFVQTHDTTFVPYLKCQNVYQIEQDKAGAIWFATADGLYKSYGGRIIHYGINEGLPTNEIRCIYPDTEGTVWIGTSHFGLCRLKGDSIYRYPTDNDLMNHNVWSIVEDDFGYLWMSSNNGIYRLKKSELNDYANHKAGMFYSAHYSNLNGIFNAEFNSRTQNKGFKDQFGHIWFPSIRGPVEINPSHFITREQFPVLVEAIYLNNQTLGYSHDSIKLSSNRHYLRMQFTTPHFETKSNPIFYYRLLGYDQEWHKTQNKYVDYHDLPGGEYTFCIFSNNNFSDVKKLHIHVLEKFNETTGFIVFIAVLLTSIPFILALWIIRVINQRRIQRKNETLFLSSMKIMSLSSQLNPHFIFNCLNTLQSMYLTKDFLKANEFMGNFSRLLRHTIEHLRKQNVTLKEEMAIVDLYVSLENAQQENVFNYQVMIDESIDTGVITLPAMLIQIFVENAIKHGLRSIPEVRGELVIQIVGTTKEVKITICDNGIGINKSLMTKKKTGISRGTELILEQVAIYNQVSSSKIYIDIKDRSEFSSESGTIVTITYLAPHDAK